MYYLTFPFLSYLSSYHNLFYRFNHQIPRFKYPAKVSQIKYGKFSNAALLSISLNFLIIRNTNIHKSKSQKNENKYHCKLKKNVGHKKLTTN